MPNTTIVLPYTFIGDEIFPLGEHLMKPFNKRFINDDEQRIFNYRLSRAWWTVECSFGMLVWKWMIFQRAIGFDLEITNYMISACICLHNYIITRNLPDTYNVTNETEQQPAELIDKVPTAIRNSFAEYFSSPQGSVPWQQCTYNYSNRKIFCKFG